ncbi:MAG: GTPase [Thermoplasmata archaeon]
MVFSFSKIPTVLESNEILDKCFKRGKKVEISKHPDKVSAIRNWDIEKLKVIEKCAKETLDRYLKNFPDLKTLDKFHSELFSIMIDENLYKKSLGSIKWARDSIVKITTSTIKSLERTREIDEFSKIMNSYFGRFSSFVEGISESLKFLKESRKKLLQIPDIDINTFTVVIAGFPNVGKSELVNAISSGKTEVAPYPFTTKGIYVGHMKVDNKKIQIIDTPGLLDRNIEKRNAMEKQAIAALKYLAHLIIFLIDPSETCGYPIEKQYSLLNEIKKFLEKEIIVVENKMDLFLSNSNNIKISAKEKKNLDLILKEIKRRLKNNG